MEFICDVTVEEIEDANTTAYFNLTYGDIKSVSIEGNHAGHLGFNGKHFTAIYAIGHGLTKNKYRLTLSGPDSGDIALQMDIFVSPKCKMIIDPEHLSAIETIGEARRTLTWQRQGMLKITDKNGIDIDVEENSKQAFIHLVGNDVAAQIGLT